MAVTVASLFLKDILKHCINKAKLNMCFLEFIVKKE